MAMSKDKLFVRININPHRKDKWERLVVEIPKGKREAYKIAARELGLSLSKLIQNGVEEYIKTHGEEFISETEEVVFDNV